MKRSGYIKRKTPLKANATPVGGYRKLRRKKAIKRKAGGTAHGRRPREMGFMSFARDRGCELNMDRDTQRLFFISHVCVGERQFAHLSDRRRYDAGDVGSGLCEGRTKDSTGRSEARPRGMQRLNVQPSRWYAPASPTALAAPGTR